MIAERQASEQINWSEFYSIQQSPPSVWDSGSNRNREWWNHIKWQNKAEWEEQTTDKMPCRQNSQTTVKQIQTNPDEVDQVSRKTNLLVLRSRRSWIRRLPLRSRTRWWRRGTHRSIRSWRRQAIRRWRRHDRRSHCRRGSGSSGGCSGSWAARLTTPWTTWEPEPLAAEDAEDDVEADEARDWERKQPP